MTTNHTDVNELIISCRQLEGHLLAYKMRIVLQAMVVAHKKQNESDFYDAVDIAHDVFSKYGNFDREFWHIEDHSK